MGGRYETLFQLARGGMATVYVGTVRGALGFRQVVAIKRPHDHLLSDPDFKRDLLTEARLASLLHHANVVDVRDVDEDGEQLSLIMDYVEGASLGELLQNGLSGGPKVSAGVAVRAILDACAGLHAAHELTDERGRPVQLVHRDISPQNLLVGLDGVTRVADFGVAKVDRRSGGTTDGHLKGKLAYMAPEYLRGEPIDRRFDIFAMGVVLWEALTGQRLFRGEHEADTLRRVLDHPAPPVSQVAPEVGAGLDAIVETALNKPREHRFENAAAMGAALEASARAAGLVASHREVADLVRASVGAKLEERRVLIRQRLASEPSVLSVFGDSAPATIAADTVPQTAGAATLASPAVPNVGTLRSAEAAAVTASEPTKMSVPPQTTMPAASTARPPVSSGRTVKDLAAPAMDPTGDLPMSVPMSVPVSSSPLRWIAPAIVVIVIGGVGLFFGRSLLGGSGAAAPAPPSSSSAASIAAPASSAPAAVDTAPASSALSAPAASASAHATSSAHTAKPHAPPPPPPPHKPAPPASSKPSTDPPPNPYAN
jgi:eukaryotic-like serine/threonine-protein kinase